MVNNENDDDEQDLLADYMKHISATIFSSLLVVLTGVFLLDVVLHWSKGEIGILVSKQKI